MTDRGECTGRFRSHSNPLGLSRGEIGVDLQRPKKKAVGDVLAIDDERDGFSFLQSDGRRNEFEALGGNRNRAGLFAAGIDCHDQESQERKQQKSEDAGELHRDSPCLKSCWMPTVPEYSRSVSSTSPQLPLHDDSSLKLNRANPRVKKEYTAPPAWIEVARSLQECFRFGAWRRAARSPS